MGLLDEAFNLNLRYSFILPEMDKNLLICFAAEYTVTHTRYAVQSLIRGFLQISTKLPSAVLRTLALEFTKRLPFPVVVLPEN